MEAHCLGTSWPACQGLKGVGVAVPVNLIRPSNSLSQNNPCEGLILEQGEYLFACLQCLLSVLFLVPCSVSSTVQKTLDIYEENPKTLIVTQICVYP